MNNGEKDLAAAKRVLRGQAMAHRVELHARLDREAAAAVGEYAAKAPVMLPSGPVAAFVTFRSELDTAPLLAALNAAGRDLCLPVVHQAGAPLRFLRWRPGDPLTTDTYGVSTPLAGAAEVAPAVLFVPLLAFDARGYRLGYGGGFYDRTLAALRQASEIAAIGLAFSGQEVPSVPHNAYDQPMDYILSENGWRAMPGATGISE